MKFLLDTNFLMIPGKFKHDIFVSLSKFGYPEFYTIDLVRQELMLLAQKGGMDGAHAKLALELIKMNNVSVLPSITKKADSEILRVAKGYTVCTNDKELIKKLKKKEVPVVILKQRKILEML